MTQLWDPYKNKLDGRSYRDRIGRPFYGPDLRAVINPQPRPSIVERVTMWWESLSMAAILVLSGCIVVAVAAAALIVMR